MFRQPLLRSCFIVCIQAILMIPCFAQTKFQKIYRVPGGNGGSSGTVTRDGGYLLTGTTSIFGAGLNDILVVKTDNLGDIEWTRTYGDAEEDMSYSVKQTFDNGFIIAGTTRGSGLGDFDMYLLKIDSIGNFEWVKQFGSQEGEYGWDVQQTTDSGYVIVGSTGNTAPCCDTDLYLLRTNSAGHLLWLKSYHGNSVHEYGMSLQQTSDKGFIICGSIDAKVWLLKIDSVGAKLWSKEFGRGRATCVRQTTDRGYILTGLDFYNSDNIILLKTDSTGKLQWGNRYQSGTHAEMGNSVRQTADGGYIVTGQADNSGSYDAFLLKTDALGNTMWTKKYGNESHEFGNVVELTDDGGYAIFGYIINNSLGLRGAFFVKTDEFGNSDCNFNDYVFNKRKLTNASVPITFASPTGAHIRTPIVTVGSGGSDTSLCLINSIPKENHDQGIKSILHNPATGICNLSFFNEIRRGRIEVYNLMGELIYDDDFVNSTSVEVSFKNVKMGIYIFKVFDGDKQYLKKGLLSTY